MQAKYKELVQSIPLERFSDSTLKMMMETKYYHAKGTSADGLLTKVNEVLKNVRIMAAGIKGIGTPLHKIPSGRSLMDMRNQFILSKWSNTNGTVYVSPCMGTISLCVQGLPICKFLAVPARMRTGAPRMCTAIGFDLSGEMHLSHKLRPRLTVEVTNVGTSADTSTQHTTQPSPPW